MALPFLGTIIETGLKILDKVIPDPKAKAEAQLKLLELQQAGEFKQMEVEMQLALGQLEVNKAEAQSPDFFRGGWRPAIGWVCALAFFYQFVGRPLLVWLSPVFGLPAGAPELDTGDLMTIALGMLGLGGMRTFERVKGKA
jgi:hypothetical protein